MWNCDINAMSLLQVPIKSLPQDWLWCETWCSKETLKTAKSIDLCNNPLTKVILRLEERFFFIKFVFQEPKLSAARRIVSEWTDYDEEMQRLGDQIAKDRDGGKAEDSTEDIADKSKDEL